MFGWIKNIGLSWKVQLAPAFLILVLVGVGGYALLALRSNQAAVDALVSGPVRQSELANELTTTTWTAHAKLYRLAATAANEKDEKKVNAKSIMGIMSLAISSGTEVVISAEGADSEQAVNALAVLVGKEELENQ